MTRGKLSGGGAIPYALSGLGGLYPDHSETARGKAEGAQTGKIDSGALALPASEASLLAALTAAADRGERCPTNEDLAELLGFGLSAPPGIMRRLEARGLIAVEIYQRERRVTIIATGRQTAAVRTPAPHWRNRPRDVPAPAEHAVRAQRPDTARDIMAAARRLRREPADFLADLVWMGWVQWKEAEVEAGASEGML